VASPPRILPSLTAETRDYWTGGRDDQLLIQRCDVCARWQHPPTASCVECAGTVTAQPVSGEAEIFTFTVNHHAYNPAVPPPYVIAIVELAEQAGLRLVTNIVDCSPDDVRIGQAVRARFEPNGDIFVPVFAPAVHAEESAD
jgi:uncharacterized OB-fold protein